MKSATPEIVEANLEELLDILRRVRQGMATEEDITLLETLIEAYVYLSDIVEHKSMTIARLQKMMFGARTEKTADVVGQQPQGAAGQDGAPVADTAPTEQSAAAATDSTTSTSSDTDKPKKERQKGHGRNGADKYLGANRVTVPLDFPKPGDRCPECLRGTVYETGRPGVLIRVVGQPPVMATIYELQKGRCSLCGKLFTAEAPPVVNDTKKYDVTAASMIGMLKYGAGFPWNRLERIQQAMQIPLPVSTQWDIVSLPLPDFFPVWNELQKYAANGDVVYNDDTTMKILALMKSRKPAESGQELTTDPFADHSERTGMFTTGIVSKVDQRTIGLFFTGRQHAGENLKELLNRRAVDLPPPIQMCDALSRNMPPELKTIIANCMAHARRQFVDAHTHFPNECGHVLEALSAVYGNDARCRDKNLSATERLQYHQTHSRPVMEELDVWLNRQLADHLVEPNSVLGKAITYILKHWNKLTLFLRVAGAPLDNNICEQALKKAILHRKNALFYKTLNGATTGDIYMSLIYTCELNGANPFDYLNELQRNAQSVEANPDQWLPWNYRETLAARQDSLPAAA